MEELINQGGEAFVLLFLIVGAIGVAIVLFITSPKKFLKAVFKDFWKSMVDKYDEEHKQVNESKPGDEKPQDAPIPTDLEEPKK